MGVQLQAYQTLIIRVRHLPVTYKSTGSFPRCPLSVLSYKVSTTTKLRAVDVMELMASTDQTRSKEEELSTGR